jgi:L-ribulose-5-phosphate 4-epimerase
MAYEQLKEEVWRANRKLFEAGLVVHTWGNVSGANRDEGVIAIKPSGVDYDALRPDDIVVLSLETGAVVEGRLRPSSDTPTHLILYQKFESVGGVVHTHSMYATAWAQACREIPCLGTTHADHFFGPVPLTRQLTPEEIEQDYEGNTGDVIVERFTTQGLNPLEVPGVLLPSHGPFAWGDSAIAALKNAIILEEVARIAFHTLLLEPSIGELPDALLKKHYMRKHGPDAYYGQRD